MTEKGEYFDDPTFDEEVAEAEIRKAENAEQACLALRKDREEGLRKAQRAGEALERMEKVVASWLVAMEAMKRDPMPSTRMFPDTLKGELVEQLAGFRDKVREAAEKVSKAAAVGSEAFPKPERHRFGVVYVPTVVWEVVSRANEASSEAEGAATVAMRAAASAGVAELEKLGHRPSLELNRAVDACRWLKKRTTLAAARSALVSGYWRPASELLRTHLLGHSEDAAAWVLRGRAFAGMGVPILAELHFDRAIQIVGERPEHLPQADSCGSGVDGKGALKGLVDCAADGSGREVLSSLGLGDLELLGKDSPLLVAPPELPDFEGAEFWFGPRRETDGKGINPIGAAAVRWKQATRAALGQVMLEEWGEKEWVDWEVGDSLVRGRGGEELKSGYFVELAEKKRSEGSVCFHEGFYLSAAVKFQAGLYLLKEHDLDDDKCPSLSLRCEMNICASHVRMGTPQSLRQACQDACDAIERALRQSNHSTTYWEESSSSLSSTTTTIPTTSSSQKRDYHTLATYAGLRTNSSDTLPPANHIFRAISHPNTPLLQRSILKTLLRLSEAWSKRGNFARAAAACNLGATATKDILQIPELPSPISREAAKWQARFKADASTATFLAKQSGQLQ